MGELTVIFYEGGVRSAWYFVTQDGKNPVLDFIETHQLSRPKDMEKLRRTIKNICEYPRPSEEMFRHEGQGIYAIKAAQARVYGFQDGRNFIMCHAVFNKRDRVRKEDLKKADKIREEYKRRKETLT